MVATTQAKKSGDWQTTEHVKTLAQMRSHIENCKEWLTCAADEIDEIHIPQSVAAVQLLGDTATPTNENIGVRQEDVAPFGVFACFLCKETTPIENKQMIVANPFTHAQCVLLCQSCGS